ncbi:DUF3473 domain-containing protein [Desulfosarcina ovata]|uniref:NodB homology domain-containing protein n=1 Tax=Desulfosarcina ovata subsp. ovata TaxID=2752305 RepID=A0A5K8A976_9BACT|nr:DUF3473 domain-containing protein [Desulfosarcina ovata]BBO88600.1 hypothetical protein DSCOOX_17800 [Desulfosarcina ovata subsp. ovata]
MITQNKKKYFLFTIDVEDWFQVENFKSSIASDSWQHQELRVERNTYNLLDLFDEVGEGSRVQGVEGAIDRSRKSEARSQKPGAGSRAQGAERGRNEETHFPPFTQKKRSRACHSHPQTTNHKPQTVFKQPNKPAVRATFFILGWIARKCPELVREIHKRGHEVASHGVDHHLCNTQSVSDLRTDLNDSKKLLEDIIGDEVCGYRAPSFSVNDSILKIIQDAGYHYDSSYNSFDRHGRYGKLNINAFKQSGIAYQVSDHFHEIPVSNLDFDLKIQNLRLNIQNFSLPWGGGGYFRLIPYVVFKKGVQRILNKKNAYSFYLHPWEIDPGQPRVKAAPASFKFRHYINLASTYKKLRRMLNEFSDCRFGTCREYIEAVAVDGL